MRSRPSSFNRHSSSGCLMQCCCFLVSCRFLLLWSAVLIMYPTTLAVIALTFSNYVLQPAFQNCLPPYIATRLLATICVCELKTNWNPPTPFLLVRIDKFFLFTLYVLLFLAAKVSHKSGNQRYLTLVPYWYLGKFYLPEVTFRHSGRYILLPLNQGRVYLSLLSSAKKTV